jgi:hypothetical protein
MTVTASSFNVPFTSLLDRTATLVPNIQLFTNYLVAGSWTKPAHALWVDFILVGVGRPGANTSGSAPRCGGGGGRSGSIIQRVIPALLVPDSLTVYVGYDDAHETAVLDYDGTFRLSPSLDSAGVTGIPAAPIRAQDVDAAGGTYDGGIYTGGAGGYRVPGFLGGFSAWGGAGGAGGDPGAGAPGGASGAGYYRTANGEGGVGGDVNAVGAGGVGGLGYGAGGGGAGGYGGTGYGGGGGGAGAPGFGSNKIAADGTSGLGGAGAPGCVYIVTWRGVAL